MVNDWPQLLPTFHLSFMLCVTQLYIVICVNCSNCNIMEIWCLDWAFIVRITWWHSSKTYCAMCIMYLLIYLCSFPAQMLSLQFTSTIEPNSILTKSYILHNFCWVSLIYQDCYPTNRVCWAVLTMTSTSYCMALYNSERGWTRSV